MYFPFIQIFFSRRVSELSKPYVHNLCLLFLQVFFHLLVFYLDLLLMCCNTPAHTFQFNSIITTCTITKTTRRQSGRYSESRQFISTRVSSALCTQEHILLLYFTRVCVSTLYTRYVDGMNQVYQYIHICINRKSFYNL